MFEGQPKGLFALALANTGERFGYYTMLAVFVLFLQDNFGWSAALAGLYYSTFLMFVYFLPFIGRYSRRQVRLWPNGHHRYLYHVPGLPLIVLPLGQRYDGDDRYHRCIGADLYGNGTVQR